MQIDYRTQAKAVGRSVDAVSIASRVLTELMSSRSANVEKGRRHGPIIDIWVLLVKRFIYPVANNFLKNYAIIMLEKVRQFGVYNIVGGKPTW